MTRNLRAAALAAAHLVAAAAGAEAERIRDFQAELQLADDGSFTVEERIRYDFEGERRHGIYREIPVRYGRSAAADYRIDLDVLSVTDAAGRARPYRVSSRGPYRRIKVGDPGRKLAGLQEYRIRYRVRRGILWLEEHDELYWNATGTEWQVPIDRVGITIVAPEGSEPAGARSLCFTGTRGSVETACRIEAVGGSTHVRSDRALGAGEGLTVVLGLPKGLLREPSRLRRGFDRAGDFVSWASVLPLAVCAWMGLHWWRNGRDPSGPVAIPVRYEPPEGMTPAEMGTVLDERADLDDVTATPLDLAVRGYLRIEETESERFFFLSEASYRLHRLREPDAALKAHERELLASLLGPDRWVDVAELKNDFYRKLPAIRAALYQQVSKHGGWFPTSPERVRGLYATLALAIAIVGGVVAFGLGEMAVLIAMLACGGVGLLWSRAMPRRTKRGRRARQQILGFKEFVERVEVDRLERLGMRSVEHFEKLLPYVFVLGAADAWADAFADLYTAPPAWYQGQPGDAFRPRHFVGRVGRSLQTVGSAMSSQPRGSGSSGFGSGGSSGGGFGGGGGGSW